MKIRGKGETRYLNVACAFDIESTSFYKDTRDGSCVKDLHDVPLSMQRFYTKQATMYAWVFGINGKCVIGRTWREFVKTMNIVRDHYELSSDGMRLICYVHNLAFEFQFIKELFDWESVFATKDRTPLKALTKMGIEFRCSLLLSGYSLAKVGEHLQTYKIEKMVGDLDYDLMRNSKTPLTDKEWGYIIHDGLVVMAYIQELLEDRKYITRIPLTKTGFVREYVRNRCFWSKSTHQNDFSGKYRNYRMMMDTLTIDGAEEYAMMKQAFQGAIVHANYLNADKVLHDVASYDFTSSYPSCIVAERFPMSKGRKVNPKTKEEFIEYLRCYLSIMEITFHDVESITECDHVISFSKCYEADCVDLDNGRVIDAKRITITITNIDLEIYQRFYRWKSMEVKRMYIYRKGYLPTDFVKSVLELYMKKTTLKGVEGMEAEYLSAKENVNASYGMCVTDIVKAESKYDNEHGWYVETPDVAKEIEKYNKSKKRFLFYAWGVFITAFARRNLASGILACGHSSGDYCYCDTDSVKVLHADRHKAYFDEYNAYITNKLKRACDFHGIDYETYCAPCDIKGKKHPLGVWDYEGTYQRAKFLGAKRYAVEYADGSHSITIAGVNKRTAIPVMECEAREQGKDFFDMMEFGHIFDEEACGKLLHTYIDEPQSGTMVDYLGNVATYSEKSSVHLEATTYEMDAETAYLDLLMGVRIEEERFAG